MDPAPHQPHAQHKHTARSAGSLAALCLNTNGISATPEVCLAKTGKTHKINKFSNSPVLFAEYLYKPLNRRWKKGTLLCRLLWAASGLSTAATQEGRHTATLSWRKNT